MVMVMVPWCYGAMVLWCHDVMVIWCYGVSQFKLSVSEDRLRVLIVLIGKLCVSAGTQKYGSRAQPSHVKIPV